MVVLGCWTLMMPSGTLSWVCQGTRVLPAPRIVVVTALSKPLSHVHPREGWAQTSPLSAILQRSQCRIGAVPGYCSALHGPRWAGAVGRGQESTRGVTGTCQGLVCWQQIQSVLFANNLIIVYSGASQTPGLSHEITSLSAVWGWSAELVQVARSWTEVQDERKVKPF